jgi:hypothetical protein
MSRTFRRAAALRKPRSVAVDQVTWNAVKEIARAQGVSISSVVNGALENTLRRWKNARQGVAS